MTENKETNCFVYFKRKKRKKKNRVAPIQDDTEAVNILCVHCSLLCCFGIIF